MKLTNVCGQTNMPQIFGFTYTMVRDTPKIGRNEPCPCGSGKKYKKCCGPKDRKIEVAMSDSFVQRYLSQKRYEEEEVQKNAREDSDGVESGVGIEDAASV
jgi:hypothetical protein